MRVFADTSALYALLVGNDEMHARANRNFVHFAARRAHLITSSFVLVETVALLQRRVGFAAVHDFHARLLPLLDIVWVDRHWYARAFQRLVACNRRDVSLVDCLSFEIMDALDLTCAFSFDMHFVENGFTLAAFDDLD
ncbi:MAG: PIN domain-containing protein [Deltaproteobacteria bacterium]|nr:PIN domain-containing protein [Deltaproteobacteria bacterium]MBW1923368.1 PIN domain-containing protein [Deltaproteobacteria bacterium]MBW1951436.1 PIN domain-containing protein [Deltaproteobacteria bacterium]MBW2010028.1 PIN domain-containing protein [Deltaproteobacteria bacterium]